MSSRDLGGSRARGRHICHTTPQTFENRVRLRNAVVMATVTADVRYLHSMPVGQNKRDCPNIVTLNQTSWRRIDLHNLSQTISLMSEQLHTR